MTTLPDRTKTALVVIDVQNDVMADAYQRAPVVANIQTLVDAARSTGTQIVWVQHSDDDLPKDSEEWEYIPELLRRETEPWSTRATAIPLRARTSRTSSPGAKWAAWLLPEPRPTPASAPPSMARSPAATTSPSSAMPTPPRTTANGVHRGRNRSSPTPTCTGSIRTHRAAPLPSSPLKMWASPNKQGTSTTPGTHPAAARPVGLRLLREGRPVPGDRGGVA